MTKNQLSDNIQPITYIVIYYLFYVGQDFSLAPLLLLPPLPRGDRGVSKHVPFPFHPIRCTSPSSPATKHNNTLFVVADLSAILFLQKQIYLPIYWPSKLATTLSQETPTSTYLKELYSIYFFLLPIFFFYLTYIICIIYANFTKYYIFLFSMSLRAVSETIPSIYQHISTCG